MRDDAPQGGDDRMERLPVRFPAPGAVRLGTEQPGKADSPDHLVMSAFHQRDEPRRGVRPEAL